MHDAKKDREGKSDLFVDRVSRKTWLYEVAKGCFVGPYMEHLVVFCMTVEFPGILTCGQAMLPS